MDDRRAPIGGCPVWRSSSDHLPVPSCWRSGSRGTSANTCARCSIVEIGGQPRPGARSRTASLPCVTWDTTNAPARRTSASCPASVRVASHSIAIARPGLVSRHRAVRQSRSPRGSVHSAPPAATRVARLFVVFPWPSPFCVHCSQETVLHHLLQPNGEVTHQHTFLSAGILLPQPRWTDNQRTCSYRIVWPTWVSSAENAHNSCGQMNILHSIACPISLLDQQPVSF